MYYDIGEKPGKGTYQCIYNGDTVKLDDDSDVLPPCPSNRCTDEHPDTKWKKID